MSFTLPELRALAIEKAETGVACRIGEGDARDFTRKRKRAYHRAYKRGEAHPAVINFILELASIRMCNEAMNEILKTPGTGFFGSEMAGLMAWLPEEGK